MVNREVFKIQRLLSDLSYQVQSAELSDSRNILSHRFAPFYTTSEPSHNDHLINTFVTTLLTFTSVKMTQTNANGTPYDLTSNDELQLN